MTDTSKITIHMVSSLDGFIAKKDNDVSWLEAHDNYERGITLSEEDITTFLKGIDCYVMGSTTYEHAMKLGWPYGDVPVIVMTNRNLVTDKKNVQFYAGDLTKLVNDRLKPQYQNTWVVGGTMVVKEFLRSNLADDIVISIMPVLLGDGILFFDYIGVDYKLHLRDVAAYKDGMVELSYEIKKE